MNCFPLVIYFFFTGLVYVGSTVDINHTNNPFYETNISEHEVRLDMGEDIEIIVNVFFQKNFFNYLNKEKRVVRKGNDFNANELLF